MADEIMLRGPAGLNRGDLMDKWGEVAPQIAASVWKLRPCELCHGRIGARLARLFRSRICHDDCFDHYR